MRPLRKGEVAEHRCSTPGCVRASADPAQTHLDVRTQSENMRLWYLRGLRDGAGFTGFKKRCGKGHAYTSSNVIRSREVLPSGRIRCRIQCRRCMYGRQVSTKLASAVVVPKAPLPGRDSSQLNAPSRVAPSAFLRCTESLFD